MKQGKIIFDKDVKVIGESAFEGLSSLTSITIPKSVQTIEDNAFKNCQNLNRIEYKGSLNDWLNITKSTNSFDNVNTNIVECNDGEGGYITSPYLTFTALENGSTVGLEKISTYQTLEYSYDKNSWSNMNTSTVITLSNVDDKVYLRGVLSRNNTSSNYTKFKMTGKIAASGNCNTIWNYQNSNASLKPYCGYCMFRDCTSLATAPELPATTLADSCYYCMFYDCRSLITAPELPATRLADYCYRSMFYRCNKLTTAPELPATTLADSCYYGMFSNCSSLTTSPELPAIKLTNSCYSYMFERCTKLSIAPEILATTLAERCCFGMFERCTSLTTAPELPATMLADSCYGSMFYGCTSLTTAPELPATTLAVSCYYCMFSYCSSLTTSPELHVTELAEGCYFNMFTGCTSLNSITCLAIDMPYDPYYGGCTASWTYEVSPTGIFYKHPDAKWPYGSDGIPDEWEVVDVEI